MIEQLALGQKSLEVHPAARKLVRYVGAYAGTSVIIAYVWMLLNGPPVDPSFVAVLGVAALFILLPLVNRTVYTGVGWKEIRLALTEGRRQWLEERLWEFGSDAPVDRVVPPGRRRIVWFVGGVATLALLVVIVLPAVRFHPGVMEGDWHAITMSLAIPYSTFSTIVFYRIFGIPRTREQMSSEGSPDEWRFPRWLDWIGRVLFFPIIRARPKPAPLEPPRAQLGEVAAGPPPPARRLPSSSSTRRLVDAAMRLSSRIRRLVSREQPRSP